MIKMRNSPTRHWFLPGFIFLLFLISLACGALPGAPASSGYPAQVTFTRQVEYGTGPLILPKPTTGLSDLSSYKAILTISFDGTSSGNPAKWSKTYVMLTSKTPAARQLTVENAGTASSLGKIFMAEMGGLDYERSGDGLCTANAVPAGLSLGERLEPAAFLGYVIGGDEAGSGKVNAVATKHYTFDQRALGQKGITESTGEVWVASDGGYVVKYLLTSKGKADYFGEGVEGTLTQDYELTDVNKPSQIKLPDDCPPGLVDAPMLQDASNVVNMAGGTSYDSSTKLADAAAFYEKEIPGLGWKMDGKPNVSDTTALLSFTRKDQTLTVILGSEAGVTKVIIVETTAPQH